MDYRVHTRGHAFKSLFDGTLQEFSSYLSFGSDVNEAGNVTGWGWHSDDTSLPSMAFRYSDAAGYVDLGSLGGASGGSAINSGDVVVGWSEGAAGHGDRAFRARPGLPMEDLGSVAGGFAGGIARADGINDQGDIVGQSDNPSGWTAFLYTNTEGMVDLNTRIPLADRGVRPLHWGLAINNAGQILAGYSGATGYGAVRLTPVERIAGPVIAAVYVDPPVLSPPNRLMVSVSVQPVASTTPHPLAESRPSSTRTTCLEVSIETCRSPGH
jgi:probable HAF family extracellular repeat protein